MARSRAPFMRVTKRIDGSKTYTVRIRLHGHKASGTFDSKDKALAFHADKRAKFIKLKPGDVLLESAVKTIAELNAAFLTFEDTKEQRSYYDTEMRLEWFTNKYGRVKVTDFGLRHVDQAATELVIPGKRTKITANRYLSCMRSAWNWGIRRGHVPITQPWPKDVLYAEKPIRQSRQRYLTRTELDTLVSAAKVDPMVEAGIVIAVTTGLRISEMLRLMWDDIDFNDAKLIVRKSKNDEPRKVFLSPPTIAAFKRLRAATEATCCFPGPGKKLPIIYSKFAVRFRAVFKAAGLKNFRWHDLRHSTASFLASVGASLPQIGSVLGHKSAQTTERYAHLTQGDALTQHAIFIEILK